MNTLPATVSQSVPPGFYTDTPEHRYQRDPAFRQLVDTLEASIFRCLFSPSELREAALLASIHFEQKRSGPFFVAMDFGVEISR